MAARSTNTNSAKTTKAPARSSAALGTNTRAVLAKLAELEADPGANPLAALALHLAGVLDSGEARSQVANVARELRACLDQLTQAADDDDDELAQLLASFRAPYPHTDDDS